MFHYDEPTTTQTVEHQRQPIGLDQCVFVCFEIEAVAAKWFNGYIYIYNVFTRETER